MMRQGQSDVSSSVAADGLVVIGKSLKIEGQLTGSEALYLEGTVEGVIYLSGQRVTVGPQGRVKGSILAKDIVVLGSVLGDCQATDRVDIRTGASLTGDITAARISIEDGAFFKGLIDIRRNGSVVRQVAVEGSTLAVAYDARSEESIDHGRYQTVKEGSDLDELLPKRRLERPDFVSSKTAAEAR